MSCAPHWELAVPLGPFLDTHASFSKHDVIELSSAFEDCLKTLRLVDRSDPAVLMVGSRLIGLAKSGVRSRTQLVELTLKSVGGT
jgi:hypothetical protein